MRILVITQRWYPDSFGGSELVAAEQARRLAERGHTVTVFTGQTRNPSPPPLNPRGGELRIYRYGSPEKFARIGGRSRTDITEVPKLLRTPPESPPRQGGERRGGWDVAILHHPFAAYGFFKAGLRVPTLYVFHASTAAEVAWEGTRFSWLTPLFVWWVRYVERAVLRRATRVAVFSEFSRQIVEELVPEVKDKVVKLSVGVDLKKFHNPPQPSLTLREGAVNKSPLRVRGDRGVTNLLTVRRLTPRMGLMELVQAMAKVAQKMAVHLTIVGEGLMRGALEREVERLGLQSCVTLAGRVAADDLPRYYKQADLFVLPTQAYEGLGMATLEALASGLPVVGTPVGATAEVLGDLDPTLITGGKPPLNPLLGKEGKEVVGTHAEDIAQGILDFFTRPVAERESLGKKARELAVDKYNWEKAVTELETLLEKLKIKYQK